MLEGGCFCGGIRYEVEGTPFDQTNCHCSICRRTVAALLFTALRVPAAPLSGGLAASAVLHGTGTERHTVSYRNRFGRPRRYAVRFDGILEGLELTVPAAGESMCGGWLVIIHELAYEDERGDLQPAWTYAHSDRESLAKLTGARGICPLAGR